MRIHVLLPALMHTLTGYPQDDCLSGAITSFPWCTTADLACQCGAHEDAVGTRARNCIRAECRPTAPDDGNDDAAAPAAADALANQVLGIFSAACAAYARAVATATDTLATLTLTSPPLLRTATSAVVVVVAASSSSSTRASVRPPAAHTSTVSEPPSPPRVASPLPGVGGLEVGEIAAIGVGGVLVFLVLLLLVVVWLWSPGVREGWRRVWRWGRGRERRVKKKSKKKKKEE
jgi:hypothetical protein